MTNHRRLMLENRRDAAISRCAKLKADIEALTNGERSPRTLWIGETEEDARENLLGVLRQMLHDEENNVEALREDLTRLEA
jgi:hypothetical protein